jgi:hypothetical protein
MKLPQVVQESTILPDIVVGAVVICEAGQERTRELAQWVAKVVDDIACEGVKNGQAHELKEVHVVNAWRRKLDGEGVAFVGWV